MEDVVRDDLELDVALRATRPARASSVRMPIWHSAFPAQRPTGFTTDFTRTCGFQKFASKKSS